MRNQLEQLKGISESIVRILKARRKVMPNKASKKVSNNIYVYVNFTDDYFNIRFANGINKLEVTLLPSNDTIYNSITIDIDKFTDEKLDEIIARSYSEIIIFAEECEREIETMKQARIQELQKQLDELQNVHSSTPSI